MAAQDDNRRRFDRERRRIPCVLEAAGETDRGFVTNVSASGLFVETKARHAVGTDVRVTLQDADSDPFVIHARVSRSRDSHRAVTSVAASKGIGLTLQGASEEYFALVARLTG